MADPRDHAGNSALPGGGTDDAWADQARPVAVIHGPPDHQHAARLHLGRYGPDGRAASHWLRPAQLRDRTDALAAASPDPGDDRRRSRHHPQRLRAAGREIVLIPTAFRRALWTQDEHPGTAIATWKFGLDTETAALRVGGDGQLVEVVVNRWATPAARLSAAARSGCRWRRSRSSAVSPFPQGSGPAGGGAPSGKTRVKCSLPRLHHKRPVQVRGRPQGGHSSCQWVPRSRRVSPLPRVYG